MSDDASSAPVASRFDPSDPIPTLEWLGGPVEGRLRLIDQTRLPTECVCVDCTIVPHVWEAIRFLRVRGAPAIGVAAAYGCVLGARHKHDTVDSILDGLEASAESLRTSRPTAVNLFWAIDRMRQAAERGSWSSPTELLEHLLDEARAIERLDRETCRAIGRHGATLLQPNQGVLTHCNAGGLATSDFGTALAVFFAAHGQGMPLHVYADETRPLLQGARLTTWELARRGIPVTLICDSMAAQVMREGRVQAVVVGADRIAANGDTANKIGTYGVALLAHAHKIPFYVAAPSSTFDLSLPDGSAIPIEQRDPAEITHGFGRAIAPEGIKVYNPAFDVTPASLISALITENGIIRPITPETICATLEITV